MPAIVAGFSKFPKITNHRMKRSLEPLQFAWLGSVEYAVALEMQRSLMEHVHSGAADTVLFLEHQHVYTIGSRGSLDDILADADTLKSLGVSVLETDRGGETTYHGPGQLIAYPIINLRSAEIGPVAWVRLMEEVIIVVLIRYGIVAHRVVGRTGVFVDGEPGERPSKGCNPRGRKIASIGMRVKDGVVMHGFALNVMTCIDMYRHIVPCGMPGMAITSMRKETNEPLFIRQIVSELADALALILGREERWIDEEQLPILANEGAQGTYL